MLRSIDICPRMLPLEVKELIMAISLRGNSQEIKRTRLSDTAEKHVLLEVFIYVVKR